MHATTAPSKPNGFRHWKRHWRHSIAIVTLLAAASAMAGELSFLGLRPSTNDLWDVSQGTVTTANSALDPALGSAHPYDARDIFGGEFGDFTLERGNVVFDDGKPAGFVHFVQWHTANPVLLRSFALFAPCELNGQRGFRQFNLRAKSPGSPSFDVLIHSQDFTPPYDYLNTNGLVAGANVTPLFAQDFRAEFVDSGIDAGFNGPRVMELDGFGTLLPEQVRMYPAAELAYDTAVGKRYQLQSATTLSPPDWQDFGVPVDGDDTTHTLLLSTRATSARFYRVVRLLP